MNIETFLSGAQSVHIIEVIGAHHSFDIALFMTDLRYTLEQSKFQCHILGS